MVGGARKRRLLLFVICCLQLWSVPPTWAAVSTSLFHCDDHIEACRCQGDYIVQCIAGNFHHVPIFSPFLTKLYTTFYCLSKFPSPLLLIVVFIYKILET